MARGCAGVDSTRAGRSPVGLGNRKGRIKSGVPNTRQSFVFRGSVVACSVRARRGTRIRTMSVLRTRADVANIIDAFVSGAGTPWDWDDFCSVRIADPELDAIRLRWSTFSRRIRTPINIAGPRGSTSCANLSDRYGGLDWDSMADGPELVQKRYVPNRGRAGVDTRSTR